MPFQRIAILGIGLIGGSLAKAARERQPNVALMLSDIDASTRAQAAAEGFAAVADSAEAVRDADVVVLAVPIPALAEVARAIAPHVRQGAIITDVASVKMPMIERVASLLPPSVACVPGHPIAGSEAGSFSASRADLFTGKRMVLTPVDPHHPAVQPVAEWWRALGTEVTFMPPDLHDRIYAAVSHLNQIIAFIYSDLLKAAQVELQADDRLRRFLRLGQSPRVLWQGIFDANKTNINDMINVFLKLLHQMIGELRQAENASSVPLTAQQLYGTLLPHIIASCCAAVAAQLEDEVGVPVIPYAGNGFRDFTAPLEAPPEPVLEAISGHAHAVADALERFAVAVQRR